MIVEGIQLNEIIDSKFLEFLKEKFGDKFDVSVSDIIIRLIPIPKNVSEDSSKSQEGKNMTLEIVDMPFIKLDHSGPGDFKNKKIILSSSNYDLLEKFLK